MGVRRTDLIILGANLEYDLYQVSDEEYDKYRVNRLTSAGDLAVVPDHMSGDYMLVGEIIQVDVEGYNGLSMYTAGEGITEEQIQRVRDFIIRMFGVNVLPKVIVLTHWS